MVRLWSVAVLGHRGAGVVAGTRRAYRSGTNCRHLARHFHHQGCNRISHRTASPIAPSPPRHIHCRTHAAPTYSTVEMEVTRSNFSEALPLVRQALAGCQFFALDCEMTGLFLDDRQGAYLDEIEDRYQEMLASAGRFQLTQYGLSCFSWEGGQYRARTFNFYLFPRPFEGWDRRFVCQSSSLDFLASCGFDFNKFIREGISYLPAAMRDAKLASLARQREPRQDILITKLEDVAFVERLVASVTEWLQGEESSLLLEAGNAYQRAIQYQQLRRDQFGAAAPPGFIVDKVVTETGRPALQLTRATPEEAAAWEQQQLEARLAAIHDAAGFAAVFEAMRDSGKPAVGHNLSFDLAYSLASFADMLPPTWAEYKAMVAHWFPGGIYDTKYLAGRLPGVFQDTTLGVVHDGLLRGGLDAEVRAFFAGTAAEQPEEQLQPNGGLEGSDGEEEEEGGRWQLPGVQHAPGFERYEGADTPSYAHEAGYDAYMTGAAFACLLRLYEAQRAQQQAGSGGSSGEGSEDAEMGGAEEEGEGQGCPSLSEVEEFRWRINISRSDIPYAALQGEDPQPDRSHIFHLSGWPPGSVRHSGEVVRRLAEAGLGQLRGTMVQGGTGVLLEVGDLEAVPRAMDVLKAALPGWAVAPYAEYSAAKRTAREEGRQQPRDGFRPQKRPRVEPQQQQQQQQAAAAAGEEEEGGKWGRCSIM